MKFKLAFVFAVLALMSISALAQVGGNDWTAVGNGYRITRADGTTFSYKLNYSPASVTRNSDGILGVTFDMVYEDSTPTKFFRYNINCQTHQYTFAMFDTSTTPATLGSMSAVKNFQPGSAGDDVQAIVCVK